MTINTEANLDISQRIAAAINSKTEPDMSYLDAAVPEEDQTLISELPLHLRNLHSLMAETAEEHTAARNSCPNAASGGFTGLPCSCGITREAKSAVRKIFYLSLHKCMPKADYDKFDGFRICKGGKVYGVMSPPESFETEGLDSLMQVILESMFRERMQ